MEVRIQAIHFEASAKLVEFINKKVERLVRRFNAVTAADVTLKVVKPETAMNKEALVRLTAPSGELLANKTADTFEEAIDLALDALESQLEKYKEKK